MDKRQPRAKPLPKTTSLRVSLALITALYAALGVLGIVFIVRGGHSWNGDTDTLTTVLAVLGAIVAVMSRSLLGNCQAAGLQHLAARAIRGSVSLGSLHKMDIALRGSMDQASAAWPWGPIYRGLFPVLAIVMSAVLKKALGTELGTVSIIVGGANASFVDPIAVGSRIRGTSFAGAILYNTTTSIGSGLNPAQASWTYIAADTSDVSGLLSVQYFMPSLPTLIAAGSSGYTDYLATSVPALASRVQCYAKSLAYQYQYGGIENGNNVISLGYLDEGTSIIQVSTAANTTWSCLAYLGTTTGTAEFISDGSGNWNISSVNMSHIISVDFVTTQARWNMMSDVISDALGTTAGYSGWDWNSGTPDSPGFASMLVSTRLSFAAATLAFSFHRAGVGPNGLTGEAHQRIKKVVIHANWALITTTALVLSQALLAFLHLFSLGNWQIDFGILQIMEMRASAADAGPTLLGHCSKFRTDFPVNEEVAIRSSGPPARHLGLVRCVDGVTPGPWQKISGDHEAYL